MLTLLRFALRGIAATLTLFAATTLFGAEPAGGAVEGRVFNAATGAALGRARIAVEGVSRETYSDSDGGFRLAGVPAGDARLTVSYVGFDPRTLTVRVPAGASVQQDVELTLAGAAATTAGETVKLAQFTVVADREMSAQAMAMNEQRNAPNIRNVVALDEYGDRGDENIGEFMRFLPGVALNDSGLVPNEVTLRGFPANNSELSIDGGQLAGARSGNTRALSLLEVPTANISRVEITKVPTPDMPAAGLGGSINLITKSGFETKRPVFNSQVYMLFNNRDSEVFGGGPGAHVPGTSPGHKQPSFDFSYLRPVNKNLALSVGGARTWREKPRGGADETSTWNLVGGFQRQSEWQNLAQVLRTRSGQAGVDWRFSPRDTVGASIQYRDTSSFITRSNLVAAYGIGATGGPLFTQGAATGVGTLTMNSGTNTEIKTASTLLNLKYTHRGENWRVDAAGSRSRATNRGVDIDQGFFNTTPAQIANVVVRGDGIGAGGALIPTRFSALTRTGAAVNPYDGGDYSLNSGTSAQNDYATIRSTAQLNVTRDFGGGRPFTLKAGGAVDRLDKDLRAFNQTWNFRPSGASDATSRLAGRFDLFDEAFNAQAPSVFGTRVRWISPVKAYNLSRQHPDWFVLDEAAAYQNAATNSRKLVETVSAAYLRSDVRLLRNRLWLIGGVRFEQTTDDGSGGLNDPSRQYQKDARGNVVLGSNGQPILLATDALARAKLRFVERGAHAHRSYRDWYPSLNASFNLTENLVLRGAYARTIGRPNVNFIIPGSTLSEPTAAQPTVTVNNSGLKPWTADNFDLSVESYQIKDGFGSIGVFQKNISNFFGATTTRATPELLERYGLPADPLYLNYDITTQTNAGDAQITGVEFTYRQSLTFLPHWARGLQAFFNTTRMHLGGSSTSDFTGFNPSSLAAGVNFIRPRFFVKLSCTYQGETRRGAVAANAANGIPAGTYNYQGARRRFGISAQYSLTQQFALYGSFTDLGGGFNPLSRIYAPDTPAYARGSRFQELGSTITVGVRATF